jgi:hypothetical protein
MRAVFESQMHDENCFVTLTYNNENLPEDKSINKKEFVNFMKRLRRALEPLQIRYLGCGEYGENFQRPHYHACIFGYGFPDKEVIFVDPKRAKAKPFRRGHDHTLFKSEKLEGIWKRGFVTVGNLTFESAAYVARYCMKKITGDKAPEHYNDREPEFALMSRMPGLGKKWIEKYLRDVYPKDFVTINGIKMRPPRYFDDYLKELHPEEFERIKKRRLEEQEKMDDAGTSIRKKTGQRMIQKYQHKINSIKSLQRSVHYE